MTNGTTTKVKTKTSTVVLVLLAGGAIAMATIAIDRFGQQRLGQSGVQRITPTIGGTGCALNCAEALQKCPCPTCPTTPTITPVPPTAELLPCEPGPDLIVRQITPVPPNPQATSERERDGRIDVTITNVGSGPVPPGKTFFLGLETTRGNLAEIANNPMAITTSAAGFAVGDTLTLEFPYVRSATYIGIVDYNGDIVERWYDRKTEKCENGENNNDRTFETVF